VVCNKYCFFLALNSSVIYIYHYQYFFFSFVDSLRVQNTYPQVFHAWNPVFREKSLLAAEGNMRIYPKVSGLSP
jgi:hypothetical protein